MYKMFTIESSFDCTSVIFFTLLVKNSFVNGTSVNVSRYLRAVTEMDTVSKSYVKLVNSFKVCLPVSV